MSRSRFGFWVFAVSSVLVGVMSLRFLVAPMELVMEHMAHYLPDLSWPIYGHIVLAPLALMLAPFQLWGGLRAARPGLHRWMGRTYGVAVVLAALSSLVMMPGFLGSAWAMVGFIVLAVLWIVTTVMGVVRARQRDFVAHRAWMLRSVALTFAAVTLRVYMAPLMADGWTVVQTYDITAWLSWVPNLIVVEYWLRGRGVPAAGWQKGAREGAL